RRPDLPVLLPDLDGAAHLRLVVPERVPPGQDVAADLDLTPTAVAAPRRAGRWIGAGAVGAGLVVVFVLTGWSALALAGSVIAGAGLTYLSGLALTLEERLAYGTVVGAAVLTMADFLLA